MKNAKKRFFDNYQGAFNEENQYQEFKPGAVTGFRDVASDFMDFASKSGMTPEAMQELKQAGVNFEIIPGPQGTQFIGIHQFKPGTPGYSNVKNLENLYNEFYTQYTDPNQDRGLFANIAGLSPDSIASTLKNMQGLATKTQGGTPSRVDSRYNQISLPKGNLGKLEGNQLVFPKNTNLSVNPVAQKALNKEVEEVYPYFSADGSFSIGQESLTKEINTPLRAAGMAIPSSIVQEVESEAGKAKKIFESYKTNYPRFAKMYNDGNLVIGNTPIKTDKEYFEAMHSIAQNEAAFVDSWANLRNSDFYKDALNQGRNVTLNRIDSSLDKDTKKVHTNTKNVKNADGSVSRNMFKMTDEIKTLEDIKKDVKDLDSRPAFMNSRGEVIVELPTGKNNTAEFYKVDGLELDTTIDGELEKIQGIMENYYHFEQDDIEAINKTPFYISKNTVVYVQIDRKSVE